MRYLQILLLTIVFLSLITPDSNAQSTQVEIEGVQRLNMTKTHFEVNTPNELPIDTLMTFRMTHSSDENFLAVMNGTQFGTNFLPVLIGSNQQNASGIYHIASITADTNAVPGMVFDTRRPAGPVTGRPLFRWQTYGQPRMTMLADGKLGLGTTEPATKLHISNGGLLVDGTTGNTSVSGAGTRMMWIPSKAAFRAGKVEGSEWDNASIGENSFVGGSLSSKASGWSSGVVGGNQGEASGVNSFIGGGNMNKATNINSSVVGGVLNNSTGFSSFVGGGQLNLAHGVGAFVAGGYDNEALAHQSFIAGNSNRNVMSASSSFLAGGENNTASGYGSFIGAGQYLNAPSRSQSVFGQYNADLPGNTSSWVPTEPLFVIGNGTGTNSRSNAMTVLKNGNVGFGTTAPLAPLHVEGALRITDGGNRGVLQYKWGKIQMTDQLSDGNFSKDDLLLSAYGAIILQLDANNNGISGSNHFAIYDDSTHLFEVRSNGNVGIGTASPASKLHVVGDMRVGSSALHVNSSTNRVGIGTSSPSATLDVVGAGRFNGSLSVSGGTTNTLYLYDSGQLRLYNAADVDNWRLSTGPSNDADLNFAYNGIPKAFVELVTGSWNQLSDARLKKNVATLSHSLDKVRLLRPTTYHFNEQQDSDKRSYGFIAQEVLDVIPEAVSYQQEEDLYTLNYNAFAVLAIGALQEQQLVIDDLKAKNEALSAEISRLDDLEAKLEKLVRMMDGPEQSLQPLTDDGAKR